MNVQNALDQFELKLIQICYIRIRYIQFCIEIGSDLAGTGSHYFPSNCFGGGSDSARTGSTLFSSGLFWRPLRFGGNWLNIIFWRIVLEAAQIWRELAPHYFPVDCFGGAQLYCTLSMYVTPKTISCRNQKTR